MLHSLRRQLTFSNVVSLIALFIVVGGTAYAALAKNSVGSKQLKPNAVATSDIKNGAISTTKLKNGAVTGAKLNLTSIGTVPSAGTANTATNADNAGTVGGQSITKVAFKTTSDIGTVGPVTVFERGGLRIQATCTSGDIALNALSQANDSSIYTTVVRWTGDIANDYYEDNEFDAGVTIDLLAGNDGDYDQITFQFISSGGFVADGTILADESDGCRGLGHIVSG